MPGFCQKVECPSRKIARKSSADGRTTPCATTRRRQQNGRLDEAAVSDCGERCNDAPAIKPTGGGKVPRPRRFLHGTRAGRRIGASARRPAAWAALGLVLPRTASAQEVQTTVPAWLDHALELTARGVEIVGIGIIVLGALAASLHFAWLLARSAAPGAAYHAYRANLGRGILLGLEFLVAADIIGTVAVDPTLYNLGVLAAIVVIRTFLSFSLEAEIEGHWPWQRRRLGTTGEHGAPPPPA